MRPADAKVELRLECVDSTGDGPLFGVARVTGEPRSLAAGGPDSWILAPVASSRQATQMANEADCLVVPGYLSPERALLAPRLALALWAWDVARLELGECAVYTSGGPQGNFVAQVAVWRSGRDVLCLDFGDGSINAPGFAQVIGAAESGFAIDAVRRASATAAGFAALVLTKRSEALDLLLEAMPVWGRLMIGALQTEPATVDFYNNVHRKGVRIAAVPATPAAIFDVVRRSEASRYLERAFRILGKSAETFGNGYSS